MFPVSDRFLDVISGTHHAVVKALLLNSTQFGPTPDGTELPILSGDVKLAATADVKSTLDLTVPGDYWPTIQPYGAEIWVGRGVAFGDGTQELVPLGYFRIDDVEQDNAPYGPIRLSCSDRISQIKQNRVLYPFQIPVGYTHRQLFERLVNGRVSVTDPINTIGYAALIQGPAIPILFNGYDPDRYTIDGGPVVENSTYDFMAKIADARDCVLRFDEFGQLNIDVRDPDPDAAPVYTVTPGKTGNLIKASRKTVRDGYYNICVAYGSDPASPTGYQLSYNNDPNSPLRWSSQFGAAPRYYASPLLRTPQAAADAAATVLSNYTGLPTTLGLWTIPNPAIRPQDAVSAKVQGLPETHIVDVVTIPLAISGAGPVEIETKTLNTVLIPESVNDGTGSGGSSTGTDVPTPAQIAQEKAFELTSTAENSTKSWWTQFGYIQDIGDTRGFTGGIAGFTSATGDMLKVVQNYTATKPGNVLAPFIPNLQTCANVGMGGSASSTAAAQLGTPFKNAWATAASDPVWQTAQINYRDQVYWAPAFNAAVADGLSNLGKAIYYDTSLNHGPGVPNSSDGSFDDIRSRTTGTKPSAGGSEATWLTNFLATRGVVLTAWGDNPVNGRISMFTALIATGNFALTTPFSWSVYGDSYTMSTDPYPYGWTGGTGGTTTTSPNPGVAHNIGSAPGQNSFNIGIGFDSDQKYGTKHVDFTRDQIAAGLVVPGYYELTPTGDVLMSAHPGGGKTSNATEYSRVEYRALERDGVTKMAFNPSTGRHYIKGRSAIDGSMAAAKPETCLAQFHDASDDTVMLHVHGNTVRVKIRGTVAATIDSSWDHSPKDWMLEQVDGTTNVYWGDLTTPAYSTTTFSGATGGWYEKAGDYMQWNLSNGDATICHVRLISLEHWHSVTPKSPTPWPQPARPAGVPTGGGTGGGTTGGGTGSAGFAARLFVDANVGNDANNGLSKVTPKLTIAGALALAAAGDTISVASGTYTGSVNISSGGSSGGGYITIRSETPRTAIINGTNTNYVVYVGAGYIRLQDLTVTGPNSHYGVDIEADNVDVRNCHIHHVCNFTTAGSGFQGGAGVNTDLASVANILIDGNEMHDIGPGITVEQLEHGVYCGTHGTNFRVTNNLLYNISGYGVHPYPAASSSGIQVINNTVANNARGILMGNDGVVRNNICYNNVANNYNVAGTGNVLSNNFAGGPGGGSGISGVSAPVDVQFVSITGNDFRLQDTSPALNAGTPVDAPPRDFAGTPRPQGTGVDAGAFEMVVGSTGTTGGTTGGGTGGSTGTGSTGGASNADDGVEAAKLLNWGAVIDGDEFEYSGPPNSKWSMYNGPGHDNNGRRVPSAFNVANGILTCTGTANGDTGGMEFARDQKFFRIEWRVRTYSLNPSGSGHRYHPVLILWPASDQWPQGGEFDFYECDCDSGLYEAYQHIPGNDGSAQEYDKRVCDISQWHNIAFEWRNNGITAWLDGQQVFDYPGFKQPPGPMHPTFQLDNFFGSSGMEPARFEAMWMRIYNPPGTTSTGGNKSQKTQAAQLILDRINSGQTILEDWTWSGASSIVGLYNDALISEYRTAHGGTYNFPADITNGNVSAWLQTYVNTHS